MKNTQDTLMILWKVYSMKIKKYRYFVGDFETTVYENQTYTEVWASALVELNSEDVLILNSIGSTIDYLYKLAEKDNIIVYYHNLKFDGNFILDYLLRSTNLKQATNGADNPLEIAFVKDKEMKSNTFKYSISDMGQWYSIIIKTPAHFIEIRDSLKLLPFSVKRIGESFGTKHKKLDMEYTGFRYAGCEITPEEKEYIANDVLVVKEALEIMFEEGHNKLTIGACCLAEYKTIIGKEFWKQYFPDLKEITLDPKKFGCDNVDKYIRKSYKGGWCYVVKGKENQVHTNGLTLDVNSLYPSVMTKESGNVYPVGKPTFWSGDYIPDEALTHNRYYFIRIKTRFEIKKNYLPFIQIKGNLLYTGNECLTSSDVVWNDKRYKYVESNGDIQDTSVTLTLTCTDWKLVQEHYNLYDTQILDGCYFEGVVGIFEEYISKYRKIKMTSKNARRELAKLYLNNLYGKTASSDNSSFKYAFLNEDEILSFMTIPQHDKKTVYIAVGSAITSYARNFTIRAAQMNYYGCNKRGFIYADTDSIHADLSEEEIKGIEFSDTEFLKWKLESKWDEGIFIRQKTYMEHIISEDKPYYNVKCAGMPERCKQLFIGAMTNTPVKKANEEELEFLKQDITMNDFKQGLKIPSKLLPKRIKGGIVLTPTTYEIR